VKPSCSVNLEPGRVTFHNFDPNDDSAFTVEVLRHTLAEIERQLTATTPQTDKQLTTLAKKKSLLESTIASFSNSQSSLMPFSATPRRDRRMAKKLRRKAARLDQMRK